MGAKRAGGSVKVLTAMPGWWRIEISLDDGESWRQGPIEYEDQVQALGVMSRFIEDAGRVYPGRPVPRVRLRQNPDPKQRTGENVNAANTVGVKPLRVEFEPVGRMHDTVRRFEGYGGRDLVIELFKKAGLTGLWKLRMFDTFKSSGRTPSVQVRRPDTHGVIIWWKPGSNDSGMRSELMVTKDTGMTPDQVYHKLKAAAEGNSQGPPPPNDDRDYAMIRLVNRANAASWGARDAFVGDIHGQLVKRPVEGLRVNVPDDTHEILDDMADRGLLYEDGNVFRVGRLGQELQYRMEEAQRPKEEAPPVVAAPTQSPAPAPAPARPMDPLEAIKAYQAQLARLANLPGEVEKIRLRRIEIGNEVSKLRAEDAQLDADEKRLLSIDVEALALLLGPPTPEK